MKHVNLLMREQRRRTHRVKRFDGHPKFAAFLSVCTALGASASFAGGLEESDQDTSILFATGNVLEATGYYVNPSVSGSEGSSSTGSVGDSYGSYVLQLKHDITDQLAVAFIIDQPVTSFITYPNGTAVTFEGSSVDVDSNALTALVRYRFDNNVSLYGGVRADKINSANVEIPFLGYSLASKGSAEPGFVLSVAYEIPDIALRASLTYNSATKHTLTGTENGAATRYDAELPQSLDFQFQTGVSAKTLVFARVRWRDWSNGTVNPPGFAAFGLGPLAEYEDSVGYSVGVGHSLNEHWSIGASLFYEEDSEPLASDLSPVGNQTTLTLSANYETEQFYVTGGLSFTKLGDVTTDSGAKFSGNNATSFGLTVGYKF